MSTVCCPYADKMSTQPHDFLCNSPDMKARAIHACLILFTALSLQGCSSKGGIDVAAGKRTFEARCASCHNVGPNARAGFAPQLNGIVGRRAGATPDYRYSPAMKSSDVVWTEQNLRAFVQDPQEVVPGTSMGFWGLSDENEVASLVAYLRTVR